MTVVRSFARNIAPLAVVGSLFLVSGCGHKAKPYKPKPAWSGPAVHLPDVPTLPSKPIKVGDSYTVWGAAHQLRSEVHSKDVKGKEISIVGWVVKTNFPEAPKCAVHPTGKADPDGCKPPVPAFWISDDKDDKAHAIKVMGFASNFAQIYDAIKKQDKEKADPVTDEFLGVQLPKPMVNVGAKVKVTGTYGFAYTKATSGIESDPRFGILTYEKVEYLEPPPEPATLPGMK